MMKILRVAQDSTGHTSSIRRVAAVLLGCLMFALGRVASGQTGRRPQATADSARLVADLFFRAVADEKWEVAAKLVDTVAIKRQVVEQVASARSSMPYFPTIEEIMEHDPQMPREVAEYQLKLSRDRAKSFNPAQFIEYEFARVTSIRELESLSALDATARRLQALDSRWMLRKKRVESGCGGLNDPLPAPIHQILAVTLGSDSVAYVLHEEGGFERSPEAETLLDPMVMRLRLGPHGWRIVPTRALLSRMNSFVSHVSCDSTRMKKR